MCSPRKEENQEKTRFAGELLTVLTDYACTCSSSSSGGVLGLTRLVIGESDLGGGGGGFVFVPSPAAAQAVQAQESVRQW